VSLRQERLRLKTKSPLPRAHVVSVRSNISKERSTGTRLLAQLKRRAKFVRWRKKEVSKQQDRTPSHDSTQTPFVDIHIPLLMADLHTYATTHSLGAQAMRSLVTKLLTLHDHLLLFRKDAVTQAQSPIHQLYVSDILLDCTQNNTVAVITKTALHLHLQDYVPLVSRKGAHP